MKQKYLLYDINKININFNIPFIIFLKGDLGAGKTTLTKHILNNKLLVSENIISPTYIYYNKYIGTFNGKKIDIYHFDLYRLKNYQEFFAIAGEDIFDNNNGIIIVEWPELIEKYYKADLEIIIDRTNIDEEREIELIYNNTNGINL